MNIVLPRDEKFWAKRIFQAYVTIMEKANIPTSF